jgi:hypothetical protein
LLTANVSIKIVRQFPLSSTQPIYSIINSKILYKKYVFGKLPRVWIFCPLGFRLEWAHGSEMSRQKVAQRLEHTGTVCSSASAWALSRKRALSMLVPGRARLSFHTGRLQSKAVGITVRSLFLLCVTFIFFISIALGLFHQRQAAYLYEAHIWNVFVIFN